MIMCGTGHRPNKLGGYSNEAEDLVLATALAALDRNRPSKVISGMALGWDQALARAAVLRNIPFIAAVPFEGQEKAWPRDSQIMFTKLLRLAEGVQIVSEGGYAPWKMQVRNQWMVDNAGMVLALWDSSEGGTGNCIKYAQKVGKPVVNVWDIYEQLTS
jgi:uncharacterized phage-like protein YoqJ